MKGQKFIVRNAEHTCLKRGDIVTIISTYNMLFRTDFYKVIRYDGLEQYVSITALIPYDRFPCSDAIDNSQ